MFFPFSRQPVALAAALCLPLPGCTAQAAPARLQPNIVLSYHDIPAQGQKLPPFDRMAVAGRNFEAHIDWLLATGYHFISVQNIIDAHAGKADLPPKAVLPSFDAGFENFYTGVFPQLEACNIAAVEAIIGTSMDRSTIPDVPGGKPVAHRYANDRE
jgi:biofilm PGA synthesis lipoprotein PgaB